MPLFRLFGVLLVLLGAPTVVSAQTAATPLLGPAASVVFAPRVSGPLHTSLSLVSPDSVRTIGPTYWKEGALIGAVAGGVGFAALMGAVCGMSESPNYDCTGNTILGVMIGAALVAIPGAFIGGMFPKGPRNVEQEGAE